LVKKVILNRTQMPFNYERHTRAQVDPPLSGEQICKCLLDPSEFAACHNERQVMTIKGHVVQTESPRAYKEIASCLNPESLKNGDVKFTTSTHFSGARAINCIEHKYGLSGFRFDGNKNRVTGLLVSSFVTYVDPEVHVKRYANILRAIKAHHSQVHFGSPDCQTTVACDKRLTDLLTELMSEDDLIKRDLEE